MPTLEALVAAIYGPQDLAAHPYFAGKFINFGYWENFVAGAQISTEARAKASRRLYEHVFEKLKVSPSDDVLEVGCGQGVGCLLLASSVGPRSTVGIDPQPEQVARAEANLRADPVANNGIRFLRGTAERTGVDAGSISKIYTIEAAEHFSSFEAFMKESRRVLRPGGLMVVCCFFANSPAALADLAGRYPELDLKLNPIRPIQELVSSAMGEGFVVVSQERIGDRVFPGFDAWVRRSGVVETWGPVWLKTFQDGLLDYFTVVFQKAR